MIDQMYNLVRCGSSKSFRFPVELKKLWDFPTKAYLSLNNQKGLYLHLNRPEKHGYIEKKIINGEKIALPKALYQLFNKPDYVAYLHMKDKDTICLLSFFNRSKLK